MFSSNVVFVVDTPAMYSSERMSSYMAEQSGRMDRQWVRHVIAGEQESECVKVRTSQFVVLPDGVSDGCHKMRGLGASVNSLRLAQRGQLNWLVIATDPALRTIRDLRGEHLDLLKSIRTECIAAVKSEFNVQLGDVMIFANYPPSVYTLHFHVCCPFKVAAPFDAFRMHTLESVIHHLEVDSEYYTKYNLHIPVSCSSRLYRALLPSNPESLNVIRQAFQYWKRSCHGSPPI